MGFHNKDAWRRWFNRPRVSICYSGPDRRKEDHFHGAFGRKEGGHIWTKRKGDK